MMFVETVEGSEESTALKEFPGLEEVERYLRRGDCEITVGEVFYNGVRFIAGEEAAAMVRNELFKKKLNVKEKEAIVSRVFKKISKSKTADLIDFFGRCAFSGRGKKVGKLKFSIHALMRIAARFAGRDYFLFCDRLNEAAKHYINSGESEVTVWNTVVVIRGSVIVTCYYASIVAFHCYRFRKGSCFRPNRELDRLLDRIKDSSRKAA